MKGYRTEKVKEILSKYENMPVELLEEINSVEEEFGEGSYTDEELNAKITEATDEIRGDYERRFREAFFSGGNDGVKEDENGVLAPDNTVEEIEVSKGETITVEDLLKPMKED